MNLKKLAFLFLLILPELCVGQVEFVSDTTIRPSRPNRYRIAVQGTTLRIVPQTGNTIPILGGSTAVSSINGLVGAVTLTSSTVSEGSNLYFTNARVQTVGDGRYPMLTGSYNNPTWLTGLSFAKLSGVPTTASALGLTDVVRTINSLSPTGGDLVLSTLNINENTNLYYTNSRARAALSSGSGAITYVSSTGVFTLNATKTDVGLANVDNTSDVNKPVSTAQTTALNLKADKSATVPYTTVSTYAAALALSVSGLNFILVTTDEQYGETNSLYLKMGGVLFKLVRNVE